MPKTHVDVMTYLDAHLFLSDVYKFRKKNESDFSYEKWAEALGVKSKSYLRFVILGKRKISDQLTARLAADLEFNPIEKEQFTLLVLYSQCEEAEQKRILGRKLTEGLRRHVNEVKPIPLHSVFADPLAVLIRNYLSFKDVQKDVHSIARAFAVPPEKVTAILNGLAEAQLIKPDGQNWEAKDDWIKVKDHMHHETLASYHRLSLQKAIESQLMPADVRNYRSLSIALNKEEYKELLETINSYVQKISGSYDSESLSGRCIYQLNFNIIPWTKPYDNLPAASDINNIS